MFQREVKLPQKNSYFLFGARGTGKTTLLKDRMDQNSWYIDLLNLDIEDSYRIDPELLSRQIDALDTSVIQIVIDEIQKLPKLLDIIHRKIGETNIQFILTGSSARKLKRGSANMLAGRAFVINLHPLTSSETSDEFVLQEALEYGTLPEIYKFDERIDKLRYLRTYAQTYLKEEVWAEQLVRKLDPFRMFLDTAAQAHGEVVNYSKIARQVGVDDKTVQNYFQILEDTLVGVLLPSFDRSVRKRQRKAPKFYYFDSGVQRVLNNTIDVPLKQSTYAYGRAFEHLVVMEIMRTASYLEIGTKFSYLRAENGAEVDLVIEHSGKLVLIEIKSGSTIQEEYLKHLRSYLKDFPEAHAICIYDGDTEQIIDNIQILPWRTALKKIFL